MAGRVPGNAELVDQFVAVAHAVRQRVNARMSAGGLSLARFRVLRVLACERVRMNELGAAVGVMPRTITTMVDALQGEGLVVRLPDPADRRAILLEITQAGRDQLAQFAKTHHHAGAAEVFDVLTASEKRQLAALLGRIQDGIDAGEPRARPAAPAVPGTSAKPIRRENST